MSLTITELKNNLYSVIEQIIETGVPVEILHRDHKIKIILANTPSKLMNLSSPNSIVINGDPEDIVHCHWISESSTQ